MIRLEMQFHAIDIKQNIAMSGSSPVVLNSIGLQQEQARKTTPLMKASMPVVPMQSAAFGDVGAAENSRQPGLYGTNKQEQKIEECKQSLML